MATIIGRSKKVAISTNGSSYTDIGKIIDATVALAHDLADETTDDSAGWKESKFADSQLTLTISGKFNSSDTGQGMLITAATGKTTYYFRWRPDEVGGERQIIMQGNVESFDREGSTGEVQTFSATIQSTGTVTESTQ
jgi:hypothetical protein